SHTISSYRSAGGYAAWEKAKTLEPAAITDEVKKSNLRGLGGAGFPTGMKWSFIPKTHTGPVYLVVNADEGEPGTFKDRYLLERGAAWFAGLGTKTQGGTRMYSVSGRVKKPGVYETSVSITLRQLIEFAGGVSGTGRLKAVVPGGGSAAILTADEIDVTMDVDGLKNAGTMIGSAGVIVMDESVSIPEALLVLARFYAHESCGQCTPCRESTGWIEKI